MSVETLTHFLHLNILCIKLQIRYNHGEKKRSLGRDYHPLCLKCHKCKRQLTPGQHAEHDEKPYCTNCYMRDFGPRGSRKPAARTFNTATS
ncbi:hypothetical protein R3I94_004590 [Phoxinus phoxinus]